MAVWAVFTLLSLSVYGIAVLPATQVVQPDAVCLNTSYAIPAVTSAALELQNMPQPQSLRDLEFGCGALLQTALADNAVRIFW